VVGVTDLRNGKPLPGGRILFRNKYHTVVESAGGRTWVYLTKIIRLEESMATILKAKRRKEIEGREKPIWQDAAYTVIIGEKEGRTTYTLIDERTGDTWPLFRWEKRENQQGDSGQGYQNPSYQDQAPQDNVPF
jgi:hypothetical protein